MGEKIWQESDVFSTLIKKRECMFSSSSYPAGSCYSPFEKKVFVPTHHMCFFPLPHVPSFDVLSGGVGCCGKDVVDSRALKGCPSNESWGGNGTRCEHIKTNAQNMVTEDQRWIFTGGELGACARGPSSDDPEPRLRDPAPFRQQRGSRRMVGQHGQCARWRACRCRCCCHRRRCHG